MQRIGIVLLPVKDEYLNNYHKIPLHQNHRDPFDRLILSTAFSEKLKVISADDKFQLYKDVVDIVWQ